MEKVKTKKDIYNESLFDLRTKVTVDGYEETAIKPYYYYRNGFLHIRYNVDRCIELSDSEKAKLKLDMTASYDKQEVLAKAWNFLTTCVNRFVHRDGVAELEKRIKRYKENGQQNKSRDVQ